MKSIYLCSPVLGLLLAVPCFAQETSKAPAPPPVKKIREPKSVSTQTEASSALTPVTTPNAPELPSEDKFEFNLIVGYPNFMSQNDNTYWPSGALGGVWVGYFVDPRALIGIRMDYFYFDGNPGAFGLQYLPTNSSSSPSFGATSPAMNIICFAPSLKLELNPKEDSPVHPFLRVGAGFMDKSMANGVINGQGSGGNASVSITGYSTMAPMVSFSIGLPIRMPDGFQIPLELEFLTGFTSGQNTSLRTLNAGLCRDW